MINVNETLNQLTNSTNGINRLISMIGAKNFVKNDNLVGFTFMRGAVNKANHISITLTAADLYDVEFIKIHGINIKTVSTHNGIAADMLCGLFTNETKLAINIR